MKKSIYKKESWRNQTEYFTLGEIEIKGRKKWTKNLIRLLRYASNDTGWINKVRPVCFIKAAIRE